MPERRLLGVAERQAVVALLDRCLQTGRAYGYNGPEEQQYEKAFARFQGGGYADGVNSGTTAVYCALGALELEPFSEVIVPPITDPGGVMPVPLLGCVPVVADAAPGSFNTSAEQIRARITRRTRAILVAHIFGEPVEMEPVMRLARRHKLYVIEDCAQAHGARIHGRRVGTFGHLAAFSTMFGKHHCTGGQGGVVYTRDRELHGRARRFADRGKPFLLPNSAGNVRAGLNCNLTDLAAAIGTVQLAKLPSVLQRRHAIGAAVQRGLRGSPVSLGWQPAGAWCVYWFLRLRLDLQQLTVDKARFCAALAAEGLPVMPDYGHITSELPWFRSQRVFGNSGFPWSSPQYRGPRHPRFRLPNAVDAVRAHFALAMHENYGAREVRDILRAIAKVADAYRR
jgi:dTDP-4-amino-4,6-dideoxygalactose transaminase